MDWIDVNDYLPEKGWDKRCSDQVLVLAQSNRGYYNHYIAYYDYQAEDWWLRDKGEYAYTCDFIVRWWVGFPKLPFAAASLD